MTFNKHLLSGILILIFTIFKLIQMKSFLKIFILSNVIMCFAACNCTKKGVEIIPDEAQNKVDVLYNGKLFTSYIYPADIEKPILYLLIYNL